MSYYHAGNKLAELLQTHSQLFKDIEVELSEDIYVKTPPEPFLCKATLFRTLPEENAFKIND